MNSAIFLPEQLKDLWNMEILA